jgi:hypothetical protein
MPDRLTAETFAPHVGGVFTVAGGTLILAAIRDGGPAPRADLPTPFALEFSGEVELEQAIHELDHPVLGRLEIFLVRTGPATYEAVFA